MQAMQACYRKLKKYKYQLVKPYSIQTKVKVDPLINTDYLRLTKAGKLTIKSHYAWDGPSGPTFDTKDFMRGSLVHDAFYQLIREGHLDYNTREAADRLLQDICREDGMSRLRAWWVYQGVHLGGGNAAKPREEVQVSICVP